VKFPYKKFPRTTGVGFVYHAVLPVYIARPEKNAPRSKKLEAFIDSGASRTTFHASIAEALGFEVKKGEQESTTGVNGKPLMTYLHDVAFYAPGGVIQIRAALSYELPVTAILGMDGFFEHFKVTFDPTGKFVDVERLFQA
jgi:aspartyl protease